MALAILDEEAIPFPHERDDPLTAIASRLASPFWDMDKTMAYAVAGIPYESREPAKPPAREGRAASGREPEPAATPPAEEPDTDLDEVLDLPVEEGLDFDIDTFAAPPRASEGRIVFPASLSGDAALATGPWQRVAGVPLPCTQVLEPLFVQGLLCQEFPHLDKVTALLAREVGLKGKGRQRPILLVGAPGIGKTRYARRLCEEMRVTWSLYHCGAATDTSFLGASRQWSGARPGYAATHVAKARVANPCIVLDSIDTATDAALIAGLAPMLDPETAGRYHDPYLDTGIDLSSVIWLATATDPSRLPASFLELFRVEELPAPGSRHLAGLVATILAEDGLGEPEGMDSIEMIRALTPQWSGGSVRKLRWLVDDARRTLRPETLDAGE